MKDKHFSDMIECIVLAKCQQHNSSGSPYAPFMLQAVRPWLEGVLGR